MTPRAQLIEMVTSYAIKGNSELSDRNTIIACIEHVMTYAWHNQRVYYSQLSYQGRERLICAIQRRASDLLKRIKHHDATDHPQRESVPDTITVV